MKSVIARIVLRYVSAAIIAHGWLSPEDGNMIVTDPDLAMMLEIGIGAAIGAGTEIWYAIARRLGSVT
jgi:hypothetical protein